MEEKVLETASLAGHILLENGAEIARVEETMERIARHYGVESQNFFVLSNGIFTTGQTGYAKVEFIPFKGAQLERVAAVNQISRDIEAGRYTVEQARERLLEIRASRPKPAWEQILAERRTGCLLRYAPTEAAIAPTNQIMDGGFHGLARLSEKVAQETHRRFP